MYEKHFKGPRKQPDNLIYGIHPILEALNAGKDIEKILLSRELRNPQVREITAITEKLEIPVQKVPNEKLDSFTKANHQGIVAFVSMIEYQPIEDILLHTFEAGRQPMFIILDRITDVRNFGAIARSAECAGVDALIIPSRGSAQVNADAIKTSAGALNLVPVHRSPNLKNTLRYLKDSGIRLIAVTEHGSTDYTQTDLTGPMAYILGSEEDGISPEYLKLCDERIKIPLLGTIGSLNVSVATGIIIFETLRQRNK
ncbi:MAG: 23S rRNA (guanosine(2251)-2'-O)-methyltransferase RlmB [Lentimicrobiaceae bacterium]|jgi:23S rRNA (guanosine2251-2'-O)-methyltransferase